MAAPLQTSAQFWLLFGLVLAGLLLFGLGYNRLVERLEKAGHTHGYLSFLVATGVAATVAAAGALIGWLNVLILAACFAASGLPMILGSVVRYLRERKQDEEAARQLAKEALHDAPGGPGQE